MEGFVELRGSTTKPVINIDRNQHQVYIFYVHQHCFHGRQKARLAMLKGLVPAPISRLAVDSIGEGGRTGRSFWRRWGGEG